MFKGWKSYYKIEPNVENEITFYKLDFPLKTIWGNVPEKDLEKDLEKLTENQKQIMIEIKKNKFVTQQELSKSIKINEKNIRNNILKLKEKGILKRVGSDRGGHWKIVDEIKNKK